MNLPRGVQSRGIVLSPTLVSEAMETIGARANSQYGPEIEGKGDECGVNAKPEASKGIGDVDVRNEDQVQCTGKECIDQPAVATSEPWTQPAGPSRQVALECWPTLSESQST